MTTGDRESVRVCCCAVDGETQRANRVLYDGDCGVCTLFAQREAKHHSDAVLEFLPYQALAPEELERLGLTAADCDHELQYIDSKGRVSGGPWAINRILIRRLPWSILVVFVYAVPIFLPLEWLGYRIFARYRHVVSRWLGLDACRVPDHR